MYKDKVQRPFPVGKYIAIANGNGKGVNPNVKSRVKKWSILF